MSIHHRSFWEDRLQDFYVEANLSLGKTCRPDGFKKYNTNRVNRTVDPVFQDWVMLVSAFNARPSYSYSFSIFSASSNRRVETREERVERKKEDEEKEKKEFLNKCFWVAVGTLVAGSAYLGYQLAAFEKEKKLSLSHNKLMNEVEREGWHDSTARFTITSGLENRIYSEVLDIKSQIYEIKLKEKSEKLFGISTILVSGLTLLIGSLASIELIALFGIGGLVIGVCSLIFSSFYHYHDSDSIKEKYQKILDNTESLIRDLKRDPESYLGQAAVATSPPEKEMEETTIPVLKPLSFDEIQAIFA